MGPGDLAGLFLQKARQDVLAAARLAPQLDVADEIVGFHAQQAIEKQLKNRGEAGGVVEGGPELGPGHQHAKISRILEQGLMRCLGVFPFSLLDEIFGQPTGCDGLILLIHHLENPDVLLFEPRNGRQLIGNGPEPRRQGPAIQSPVKHFANLHGS